MKLKKKYQHPIMTVVQMTHLHVLQATSGLPSGARRHSVEYDGDGD